MAIEFKHIKVGDTIEYDYVLDANRGSYKVKRGVVIQKRGRNLEVDQEGSTDWWYWPHIRHSNVKIVNHAEAQNANTISSNNREAEV